MGFKNNVSGTISNLSQQLKLQADNSDSIRTGATDTTKLEENMEIVDFKKVNNAPENAYTDTASNKSIYSDTMLQYMNAESQYKNLDNKKKELQSELNTLNMKVNQEHVSVDQFVGDDDDYSDDLAGLIDKGRDYAGYLFAAAYTNTVSGIESVFTGILFNSDGSLMSYEDYLKSQLDGEVTFNGTEEQIKKLEQNHKDYYAKLDAYVRKNTGMSYEDFEAKRKKLEQDIETIDSYKYPLRQMVKEKPYIEISETDEFQNYKSSLGNINAKIDELETSQKFNESKRYLNDDDKTMYLYLLENKGKEAADDYLKAIQDKINKSKGYYDAWELIDSITETEIFDENGNLKLEEIYEMDANGNIITDANGMPKIKLKIMENIPDRALDDVKTAFAGLEDGVNTFINGINNILTTEGMMSDEQYKQTYLMTFLAQAQNSGIDAGNLGHIYNISNSIGNMAIPIVVGMMINAYAPGAAPTLVEASGISASSFVSTGLIGLSVFGNSKNDALVEGHDLESATVYALCSALSETSLQLFLGNIPILNPNAKFAAKEILSEGFEEFLQTWVDAGMRAVIFKEKPNFESLTEESFQAFIYGCVTSGVLTGGQSAISFTLAGVDYTFSNLEEFIEFIEKRKNTIPTKIEETLSRPELPRTERQILEKVVDIGKMSQLELARFLYYELGRKLDYSEQYKHAVKYSQEDYEKLYNRKMTFEDLDNENGIICVNWAQLYSQLLVDAGFRKDQIVIQRVTKDGEFLRGSHAGIYVVLDDGSIIMPDLTAPLGTMDDTYNVKVNNETTGFIIFTPQQIQEILQASREENSGSVLSDDAVKKLETLDIQELIRVMKQYKEYTSTVFTVENRDMNSEVEHQNLSDDQREFLNIIGEFLFATEGQPKGKDGRLQLEKLLFEALRQKNRGIMSNADQIIEKYKSDISEFIDTASIESMSVDSYRQLIIYQMQHSIDSSFLSLDNIKSTNMIAIRSYMIQMLSQYKTYIDITKVNPEITTGTFISMMQMLDVPQRDGTSKKIPVKIQFTQNGAIVPFVVYQDGKQVAAYTARIVDGKVKITQSNDLYISVLTNLARTDLSIEQRLIYENILPDMSPEEIIAVPQKLLSAGVIQGTYQVSFENNSINILAQ